MSCKPTRHLGEDEVLLKRVKIELDNNKVDVDGLQGYVKQRPNKAMLKFFRVNLGLYNYAHRGNEGRFKRWLKTTDFIEPPTVWDANKSAESSYQLSKYLKENGYFRNRTWYSVDTVGWKSNKVKVTYHVQTGKPYLFGKVTLGTQDVGILEDARRVFSSARDKGGHQSFVDEDDDPKMRFLKKRDRKKRDRDRTDKLLIWPGNNYNVNALVNERTEFAWGMRNLGYFKFSQEHISFEMDSLGNDQRIDVKEIIRNPSRAELEAGDTTANPVHKKHYVRNIYVDPAYNSLNDVPHTDTTKFKNLTFVSTGPLTFKPEALERPIFIRPGTYSLYREEFSYKRLTGMKAFRFVDIEFVPVETATDSNYLDCKIKLTPAPKQAFTIASDVTHRSSNLGISGNLVYQNRNVFKGGELFQFKLQGGLEGQRTVGATEDASIINVGSDSTTITPFNTVEYGAETSLTAPRLIVASRFKFLPRVFQPTTSLSALFNFQSRPDYQRVISSLSVDYRWQDIRRRSHSLSPVDFSLVGIDKSADFQELLDNLSNSFLKNSYSDHLIISNRYGYSFTNQKANKLMPFYFFKANIENAGNLMRLVHEQFNPNIDADGSYRIFDIPFAQYVRGDLELIYNEPLSKKVGMAYRAYVGVGVPLKNFSSLPFEKSFFSGGANGIRAWSARSLGPGSSMDSTSVAFDKIGNLKLEFNAEYRFDIIKSLEGALFLDAGNIWLIESDQEHPGSEFQFKDFYKEIALGGGGGLRIDFSFFVIRFDAGFKLYDPGIHVGERWFYQNKEQTNLTIGKTAVSRGEVEFVDQAASYNKQRVTYNIGIGYPF